MARGKLTVAVLSAATVVGVPAAEIRDHPAALHLSHEISPDAGAVAGTAIIQQADLGFLALGSRVPVEVRQGRYAYLDPYHRGGAVTPEEWRGRLPGPGLVTAPRTPTSVRSNSPVRPEVDRPLVTLDLPESRLDHARGAGGGDDIAPAVFV